MQLRWRLTWVLACLQVLPGRPVWANGRTTLLLDGQWQIAQGNMQRIPERFDHTVPVPGLVDMATPSFTEVGQKSAQRQAFWYRRTFRVAGDVPACAQLKLSKAAYGARVYLNGRLVGEHLPSFTPAYFDVRSSLRGRGALNELVVRIGAYRDSVPPSVPAGWDFEKTRYIPGIFDNVTLIMSGNPAIQRVQVAPDIARKCVRVQATITANASVASSSVQLTVREARGAKPVGARSCKLAPIQAGQQRVINLTIPITGCRLWSPESPFLYELETQTASDSLKTTFGMREFRLNPKDGRAYLNGKPYYLRGSNITLYRFFEDPQRGALPWDAQWVRKLHRSFKGLNWNSLRYCIGFPPEQWYRIADEEGILIQDEFPLWHLDSWPAELKRDELVTEYTEWMQERWNHPCVVVWDAQNETHTTETTPAIQAVRHLDLSGRPWDNGWDKTHVPGDSYEWHPYHFMNSSATLATLAAETGQTGDNVDHSPVIVNEYGWLWLNRDGTPTTLTRDVYRNLLGPSSTTEQRRDLYARYMAAETELWRSKRTCAGVLQFCALGYSRPDGQTSDNFLDVRALRYEPKLYSALRDAFNPVGVMIDVWSETVPQGSAMEVPVVVINDLEARYRGKLRLRLLHDGKALNEQIQSVSIGSYGRATLRFSVAALPAGDYELEAALIHDGQPPVCSHRRIHALTQAQLETLNGYTLAPATTASSSITRDGVSYPASNATDSNVATRWSSDFEDPQWLQVDLGSVKPVSKVVLLWEAACARAFEIQTSTDATNWSTVYSTDQSQGGAQTITFATTRARYMRMMGTARATKFGYSLWEMRVFP